MHSDDRSKRDGSDIYLPPPPSTDDGPAEQVRVPRVNPPSPALEAFVRERPKRRKRKNAPGDLWIAVVALIALAAGLAYLFR
jgi:hypothetical protein